MGRWYSRGRTEAARVRLRLAEERKAPAEFEGLRKFLSEGTPEAIDKASSALPDPQRRALVEGALDPEVQAVREVGLGLAYLQEKKYEEAVLAFRAVEVKYFQVPEEHARALFYLAQAADAAAGQATGEAKKLYESWRDDAQKRLKEEYPNSPWAGGGR